MTLALMVWLCPPEALMLALPLLTCIVKVLVVAASPSV